MEGDTRTAKFGSLLQQLANEVSGKAAPEISAATPAGQITKMINDVAGKLKIGDILDKLPNNGVKDFVKTMIGNNPLFIVNILFGAAIKFAEQAAFMFKKFNPDISKALKTADDLILGRMNPKPTSADADLFRKARKVVADKSNTYDDFKAKAPTTIIAAKEVLNPTKPETPAVAVTDTKAPAKEAATGDAAAKTPAEKSA